MCALQSVHMLFMLFVCFFCSVTRSCFSFFFFFFNDTATTEIYTLSLHDALPICTIRRRTLSAFQPSVGPVELFRHCQVRGRRDRKSTRLNSSHTVISYAVFCLKKKKKIPILP